MLHLPEVPGVGQGVHVGADLVDPGQGVHDDHVLLAVLLDHASVPDVAVLNFIILPLAGEALPLDAGHAYHVQLWHGFGQVGYPRLPRSCP